MESRRCFFCNGNIIDGRCIMCGRSTNIQRELRVQAEQRKPHHNWHTYSGEVEKMSKLKKGNPNGYGKRNAE